MTHQYLIDEFNELRRMRSNLEQMEKENRKNILKAVTNPVTNSDERKELIALLNLIYTERTIDDDHAYP
jgi:hypothetical protein